MSWCMSTMSAGRTRSRPGSLAIGRIQPGWQHLPAPGGDSAVDGQRDACDEGSQWAEQKRDHVGNFGRAPPPLQRDSPAQGLEARRVGVLDSACHTCPDRTRTDGVDADTGRGEVDGRRPDEVKRGGLGGRIRPAPGLAAEGGHGGIDDDRAAAALSKGWYDCTQSEDDGPQIDIQTLVEARQIERLQGARHAEAGVQEGCVEPAEPLLRCGNRGVVRGLVRDISRDRTCPPHVQPVHRLCGTVDGYDPPTDAGEVLHSRPPDTRRCAGDDSYCLRWHELTSPVSARSNVPRGIARMLKKGRATAELGPDAISWPHARRFPAAVPQLPTEVARTDAAASSQRGRRWPGWQCLEPG